MWRHPSEVAASQRAESASSTTTTTIRTPLSHALGLATIGAVGGALVVTGLFLSFGGSTVSDAPVTPVIEAVGMPEISLVRQDVPEERWPEAVTEAVAPGIAELVVTTDRGMIRTGSGVFYRTDGYLLTTHALVHRAATVDVTMRDGSTHEGEVLGTDHISGVAVVHIDVKDHLMAPLAIIGPPPEVGDPAVAIGGAAAHDLVHADISARNVNVPIEDNQNLHGLIQVPMAMPSNGEGGALVDKTGTVIGLVVDVDTPNTTYAVPIGYARKVASELGNDGRARHSWLGIRGVDLDEATAASYGLSGGVRTQSVIADSPADQAGLTKGAVIVAVDGAQVTSMSELILELRLHPPGQIVELSVLIDGEKHKKAVELAMRTAENTT